MSLVNVTSVEVGKNPASVLEGFRFEVVFECLDRLEADLEWKFIYVGSSDDKVHDQELDCVVMGPVNRGALKFTFEADAPDFSQIPQDDILGFTIILLTGSYRDEEFIRIGWYVHNIYVDPEMQEDPPLIPQLDKMQRIILTEAPRVTRFRICWDNPKPSVLLTSHGLASGNNDFLDSQELESVTGLVDTDSAAEGNRTQYHPVNSSSFSYNNGSSIVPGVGDVLLPSAHQTQPTSRVLAAARQHFRAADCTAYSECSNGRGSVLPIAGSSQNFPSVNGCCNDSSTAAMGLSTAPAGVTTTTTVSEKIMNYNVVSSAAAYQAQQQPVSINSDTGMAPAATEVIHGVTFWMNGQQQSHALPNEPPSSCASHGVIEAAISGVCGGAMASAFAPGAVAVNTCIPSVTPIGSEDIEMA